MEVITKFFKQTISEDHNCNINELEEEHGRCPLIIIESNLKELEEASNHKTSKFELENCYRKIIVGLESILNNRIITTTNKSPEKQIFWNYISKYFRIASVRFINNIFDKKQSKREKGLEWLFISIFEHSLNESFYQIYAQGFNIRFYESDSLLSEEKPKILSLTKRIDNLRNLSLNIDILKEYEEFKKINNEKQSFLEDDSPHLYFRKESLIDDKNFYTTPINSLAIDNQYSLKLQKETSFLSTKNAADSEFNAKSK